ncbi:MAG: T9SS type A sorting domain-containing protein [Crocinitomicaceae bacterium]|nr:T9SS type A sorting domain-containing protein [Crocinitomicaceae bacterium]
MKKNLLSCFAFIAFTSSIGWGQCLTTTGPTNDCSYGDAIDLLTIDGTTAANSGCSSGTGYSSFVTPVWNFDLGASYSISLNVGGSTYNQGVAIWIDMDNNGEYGTSELIWTSGPPALTHTGTITIPATGYTAGTVPMRVMCVYNQVPGAGDACTSGLNTYGETEDYLVQLNSSSLTDDVELTSVVSPLDNDCGLLNDSLIVQVTNNGSNDATNIDVSADLTGLVTTTFSTTITSLLAGASTDVFLGLINTEAGGTLDITASVSMAGDLEPANDTLVTTLNILDGTPLAITGPAQACDGESISLSVNFSGTEVYTWTENGLNPVNGNTINSSALTTATEFVVVSSNTCREADTLNVSIVASPTASFTHVVTGGQVTFTGTASNYDNISWDFGDSNSGSGINASHTYSSNAAYTVCMTATNQCDTVTFCDTVDVQTLELDLLTLGDVTIYPNPTDGYVKIQMKEIPDVSGNWTLVDLNGQKIQTGTMKMVDGYYTIELSLEESASGTYLFYFVGDKGQKYQTRIIKQ